MSMSSMKLLPASILAGIGASLTGCQGDSNSHVAPVMTAPTVVSTVPADLAAQVLNTTAISVRFDRPMDSATLTPSTFTIACPSGTPILGNVTYNSAAQTASFSAGGPLATDVPEPLPADENCTATITTGAKDTNGIALASDFAWSFTTTPDVAFLEQGKQIFRFDTFGDETKWTDALRMHEVIAAAVDPTTALSVGLKVDVDALPPSVVQGIADGSISLTSPDTTVVLISLDAVVGIKGTVESSNGTNTLTRVGITCALCHSTVDDSFAPGIGKRLDGWANRDLNPGAIIALSPALDAAQKAVFNSWGPGKYDPRFNIDGINGPQVISPAYGLEGIHSITATGDGNDVAYWNRYVGVTQMGGHGTFSDPRIGANGLTVTNGTDDQISSKLPALQAYQLSIDAPPPPIGSFDQAAADRGKVLFDGSARCATCHSGPEFTDGNMRLHAPSEVVSEPEPGGIPSYASRSATRQYRTAPLKGLWQHPPYFHNGTAATLEDVVEKYNTRDALGLTQTEVADLAEYLKSL